MLEEGLGRRKVRIFKWVLGRVFVNRDVIREFCIVVGKDIIVIFFS